MHLTDLTAEEALEILHCRLATIESFLASSFDGFRQDLVNCVETELESSGATAAQKKKILDKMAAVQAKHPKRKSK